MKRLAVLAIGVALILGACGGDDEVSSDDSASDDAASSGLATGDDGGDAVTSGIVDDGGGDVSGDPPDACSLLELDDVTAQGIAAASGPTPTEGARFDECTFGDDAGALVMQVQVFPPDEWSSATSDDVDVPGIGEAATYSAGFRTLSIERSDGSTVVLYSPFGGEPEDPEAALIELGRIAAG